LETVLPYLRSGDFVYFDEPLDMEEAVILKQLINKEFGGPRFEHFCGSPISLALKVV